MAITNIRKTIEGIYARIDNKIERGKSDRRFVHIYKVKGPTFAKAFEKALLNHPILQEMAEDGMSPQNVVDYQEVYNATKEVIKSHKSLISRLNHRTVKTEVIGSDTLKIYRSSGKKDPNIRYVQSINSDFKKEVFKKWQKKAELGDVITPDVVEGRGKGLDFSHTQSTNIANATLLNHLEASSIDVNAIVSGTTESIAEKIFALLGIDWKLEQDPETGKMEWIITGELAGANPDYIAGIDLGPEWEQFILDKFQEVIDGTAGKEFKDPGFVASVPFTQQVLDNETNKMVDYYKSVARARIKGRPKKHKKTKRANKVRNKFKAPKNTKISVPRSAVTSMRRERGKGRQASTQGAAQLTQLKKYINSRLPAEVRRNMGRPALQNQTGRFSNSVQLLSLMEGKSTIMAKYTYLLSPYGTFENTGRKRWPLAYNPKTIIAKSIRNLAQGRIENKLTLRRV